MTTDQTDALTYYKWLYPDRVTTVQKHLWPVRVKSWTENQKPMLCKSGWHAMKEQDILAHLPTELATLWRVEGRGEMVEGDNKVAFASMRLIEIVGTTNERLLRHFACDCVQRVAHLNPDPRVQECIDVARRFADGEARDVARAAARDAARAAAGTATWNATGAAKRAAAYGAAWAAAWDATRDAARDAARAAAWDAAGDAAWNAERAGDAEWAAARAAEKLWQSDHLLEMLIESWQEGPGTNAEPPKER